MNVKLLKGMNLFSDHCHCNIHSNNGVSNYEFVY